MSDAIVLHDLVDILRAPIPPDRRTVEEIRDETRLNAALHSGEALEGLLAMARDPETSERVRQGCWIAILDRGGVNPPSAVAQVNVTNTGNILIAINQRRNAIEEAERLRVVGSGGG